MNKEYEVVTIEIGKLELKKNDYLVLKFPENRVEAGDVMVFIEAIRNSFPELYNRAIFFLGDVEISVINKEEEVLK